MSYSNSGAFFVGQIFSTGNAVINQLPVGTKLETGGPGTVRITFIPAPPKPTSYAAGERVRTKYGIATVLNLSSRLPFALQKGEFIYVADGTLKVRRALASEVSPA